MGLEKTVLEQETVESLTELGRFVSTFEPESAGRELQEQLTLTLVDTLGVMIAGGHLPEVRALAAAWVLQDGPSKLFGMGRTVGLDASAYLNGVSAVSLELDEGNKYARGHPASHTFPAALAVAQARGSSGRELVASLIVGYEAASRFGRATRLNPGVHPHGNWGVAGAAAAASRLMGLGPDATAAALDAAGGMALATPFESALVGNAVRNVWVGMANVSGLTAARMAASGTASVDGTPSTTLGGILGTFHPGELTAGLGRKFDLQSGYFKRHASCSYTHPPADAVMDLLVANPELRPDRISSVLVETHGVAAPLSRTECRTRLSAMFSIPYVVSAALVMGNCHPAAFGDDSREDPAVRRLMSRTRVVATEEFDGRLPEERGARVTVTREDGSTLSSEVPNPVGDVAYKPFGMDDIHEKLAPLLEPAGMGPGELEGLVREAIGAENVNDALRQLP